MKESMLSAVKRGISRIAVRSKPTDFGYDTDLVSHVDQEFERRRNERRPFELQWRLNMAFIDGNQYMDINAAIMDLFEIPKLYWWQEREVFNHCAPIIETRIARISRMQPILKVRPATSEDYDLSGAKVETRLLDYFLNERLTMEDRNTLFQWMEGCGTAFLKPIWDSKLGAKVGMMSIKGEFKDATAPDSLSRKKKKDDDKVDDILNTGDGTGLSLDNAGKKIYDDMSGDPTPEEFERQHINIEQDGGGIVAGTLEPIYEGDIDVVVVPPYEIFPDSPWHPTIDDCRRIMHARAYPVEEIYEMYGVKVDSEPVDSYKIQTTTLGLAGLGYGFYNFNQTVSKIDGYAVLKEEYEKPTSAYPDGRLIVVAGHKLLHVGALPYRVGPDDKADIGITKFDCIRRPGCFWGRSIIERIVPVQRRYNAVRNRKAEHLNRVAIGQVIIEENSVDADWAANNAGSPGAIWIKKKGFADPHFMETPGLPPEFREEESALLNEFTYISGVSEIARNSEAPPGIKSGVALAIAIEQDDTRLSHTVGNYEMGLVDISKQVIRLYRQFATQKRMVRTIGADMELEMMQWDNRDVRSDDVIIETSAMLAETPAQRRAMVFDMMQSGLFNDPDTGKLTKDGRAKVLDLMQFGHWELSDAVDSRQISRAEKENRIMDQGQMVQVSDVDDDVLHVTHHNNYRLTDEYDQMNQAAGGTLDQIFKMHTLMHLQKMHGQAQAQPGAPTPPGQPQAAPSPGGPPQISAAPPQAAAQ
jgi:nicotinamide mononucleotide adenylyltransferase